MSGIVRTYEGRGDTHAYTGMPGAKHYAAKFRVGQARPISEMNVHEAQEEVTRRVRCYIEERPGVDAKAARKAILHDDEDLRRAAYPLPEERQRDESQPAKAARHQSELAALYLKQGRVKTYRDAVALANEAAPEVAERAGAAPLRPAVKTHTGPGTQVPLHGEARTLPRDVLVRQIAAAALKQGTWRPGPDARALADAWFGWNFPAPPAGSGKDLLDSYNALRERTVNEIVEASRRLLADPAERGTLHPAQ